MRTRATILLGSVLALGLFGCSDVPAYWADLGVTAKGGETQKDMAKDSFFVVFYKRDASELATTCKEAYTPIVAKGWTPAAADPAGPGSRFDQVLKSKSDTITVSCTVLPELKQLSVTFAKR